MEYIKFIWDEKKAKSNVTKHGIAFDEASTVFNDDNARVIYDPDHSEEEDRFIILGLRLQHEGTGCLSLLSRK